MKLAAVVILYNPEENVFENILTYLNGIDKLYIYDNSKDKLNFIPKAILEKSEYIHTGHNDGISKRLNEALIASKKEGFDFLLTMDQDSSFEVDDLKKYIELIKTESKSGQISMYGISHCLFSENKEVEINKLLITSGSIINVKIAEELNGFDEALFIDGVDTEFCIKSYVKGYKTILFNQIQLNHSLGLEKKTTYLFSKKERKIKFHTPTRIYYILRNHLYIRKKYPEFNHLLKYNVVINEIKNGIVYGESVLNYFYYVVKAFKDFKKNKIGGIN